MSEITENSNYYTKSVGKEVKDFSLVLFDDTLNAVKHKDYSIRSAAFFVIGNLLNHELLESNRKSFCALFELVLNTYCDENSGIRFSGIMILKEIMDEKFLELEKTMFVEGIEHLRWATNDTSKSVSEKALDTLLLKEELWNTHCRMSSSPPNLQ